MEFAIFFKGICIGFALAVPIGPIGIMCIRKTITEGRLRGFIIGLGAATADLIYGTIAAFGLTFISNTLITLTFIPAAKEYSAHISQLFF